MKIELTDDWDFANAMVDGWGGETQSEVHCRKCVLEDYENDKWTAENIFGVSHSVEQMLDGCHRGGFVPAIVDGFVCDHCGVQY